MSTCEHGQKITMFCATECCQWKDAGGCQSCMKKYHSHMGPTRFLKQTQINELVKKYVLDSGIKPKCRTLQQAIYNYFTRVKAQLTAALDSVSKIMINQIGYPYLYNNGQLAPYKRLKNKEYKKLIQKEFRQLVEATDRRDDQQFLDDQAKIYYANMDKVTSALGEFDGNFTTFEKLTQKINANFQHDGSLIKKIREVTKNINDAKEKKGQGGLEKPIKQNLETRPTTVKQKEKQKPMQEQTIFQSKPLTRQDRNISLEKNFKKTKRGKDRQGQKEKSKQKLYLVKSKTIQNETLATQMNSSMTNSKQLYKNKEDEISMKKQKLIDLMKPKQTNKPPIAVEHDISLKSTQTKDLTASLLHPNSETSPSRQRDKARDQLIQTQRTRRISVFDDEIRSYQSNNSEFSEKDQRNQDDFQHTILPREDSYKKIFQDTEEVVRKMIVVPVPRNIGRNREYDECQSPLIKKKKQKLASSSLQQSINLSDASKSPEKMSQSSPQQQIIKQNEQKSLALLIKSLGMKTEEAIPHLQSAIRYADNNLSAAQYLSYLLLEIGRPKQCLNLCNRILVKMQNSREYDDLSINLNNNKTAALNILGRYSESIVILEKTISYKAKDTLFKNLADAYFSIGIFEKAIYNYEKAIELYDEYDEAHYNLAVCLFAQGNYYNAELAITNALEHAPKNMAYKQLKMHINERIQKI